MEFARIFKGANLAIWVAIGGLALSAGQGCSSGEGGDPNGRVVSGRVTYQGNPVEGAVVTFKSPQSSAFGRTDAEGKFKLNSASGERIPLGDYQVSIVKKESLPLVPTPSTPESYVRPSANASAPAPKDLLPGQYGDAAKSGLSASVTADGKNEFEFPLSG
jgi:hypothetical protein